MQDTAYKYPHSFILQEPVIYVAYD